MFDCLTLIYHYDENKITCFGFKRYDCIMSVNVDLCTLTFQRGFSVHLFEVVKVVQNLRKSNKAAKAHAFCVFVVKNVVNYCICQKKAVILQRMVNKTFKFMKKRFLLVLAAVFASVALHAQFGAFTQMEMATPHYYPGVVYFTDGHSEEFFEVELPRANFSKTFQVKKSEGDKKRTKINKIDVEGIKIWHRDFPDKVHTLYSVRTDKSMAHITYWGNPIAGSAWGVVYLCDVWYKVNKKNGDLDVVKFYNSKTGERTHTLYFLRRAGEVEAELLMYDNSFYKKNAKYFFSGNQVICDGIMSGKLKVEEDLQYILDEMAGDKKAEASVKTETEEKASPETKTDSVHNGVVGDDE